MMEAFLLAAGVVAGYLTSATLRRSSTRDAYDAGFNDGVLGERYSAYHPSEIVESAMDCLVDRARKVRS